MVTKRLLLSLIVALTLFAVPYAQTDPTTLPRLDSSGLQYVGAFRMPGEFAFGGRQLAFNPAKGSLFVTSQRGLVGEVSIPTPVNSATLSELPSATLLQPLADTTDGRLGECGGEGVNIAGLFVQGDRLTVTCSIYFDATNSQTVSHGARSVQLNQASFSGWSQVWAAGKQGYVAGWMAPLPAPWQTILGGAAMTGQCCLPIISRTSLGPSAFAFDPSKIGQPTVAATPLLYYTGEHATLGPWDGSNPTYGMTTGMGGLAVIEGTRSALFFGRNGVGPACYGTGTADQSLAGKPVGDGSIYCYDPVSGYKAVHAYPYRYQIWAYDLSDFAAVKAGTKQPWEIVPYGVWPIELPFPEKDVMSLGVAYDARRQWIYVSQPNADPDGYRPLMHVFKVNAASPVPVPVPTPVDPTVAALEARLAEIKSLIQQALTAAPKNTATRVTAPLKTALTK